jgi:hypothetical protein
LLNDIYGEICIPEAVFEEVERGGGIDVPSRKATNKYLRIKK